MKLNIILEMMEKKRVVRDGKWATKYSSDREGYKIKNDGGSRSEVKMSPTEIKRRRIAGKRAAKKMKGQKSRIAAKRKLSMAKRGK